MHRHHLQPPQPETYAMGDHVGWIVVLGFLLQGVLEYGSQALNTGTCTLLIPKPSVRMPGPCFQFVLARFD